MQGYVSFIQQVPDILSSVAAPAATAAVCLPCAGPCQSYRLLSPQHRDCYMFHATSENVIDNTCMGNTSRFTNHCCSPCLYVKVLELQGDLHLCFFAKKDIRAGQELTFDYR